MPYILNQEEIQFLQVLLVDHKEGIPQFSDRDSILHEISRVPIGVKVAVEVTTPTRLIQKVSNALPAPVEEIVNKTGLEISLIQYILDKYKRFVFNAEEKVWERSSECKQEK